MKTSPPHWPARLLHALCDPELIDEISGDLDEMFQSWVKAYGIRKARRLYIWHTLKFLRPFIFKKRKTMTHPGSLDIAFNIFKTSWRNIIRHKVFAGVNVVGLTLSFACIMVIYALCMFHLGFDNYHPDKDSIYRVTTVFNTDEKQSWPVVPQPLGKAIRNDISFPEVTARIRYYRLTTVSVPEAPAALRFQEDGAVAFTEPEYFQIFRYTGVADKVKAQLREPNTAMMTKQMATKYFGTSDAVNQTIRISSRNVQVDFRVIGVVDDIPANTDQKAQIFLSYENLKDFGAYYASDKSWGSISGGMFCFVKLRKNASAQDLNAALPSLVKKYYPEEDAKLYTFVLQPLSELHIDPKLGGAFSLKYVWILGTIGLFLLAIACFNFVNLSSSQVLSRAREAGIRKVLGSRPAQLYAQFMTETALIGLLSVILAMMVVYTVVPLLNMILKSGLAIGYIDYPAVAFFAIIMVILVVLMAGSYPALLISRFKPVTALKGKLLKGGSSGISLRRVLIVTQFSIAQALIIGMIVIGSQVKYSTGTDLGFDKDAVLMLPIPEPDISKMKTFSNEILAVAGVRETSLCYEPPASQSNTYTNVLYENREKEEPWEVSLKEGDDHFVSVFGLSLAAGRNFLPSDSAKEFLVNETFVRKVGLARPEDMIGKTVAVSGSTFKGTVVGVVKDFNDQSLHEVIHPICIMPNYARVRSLAVKLEVADVRGSVDRFRKLWTDTYPQFVFNYQFFDQNVEQFYATETAMLLLVEVFAAIAIVVSCLGLYGLVSFMAIQRTKEISVRKVLGAGIGDVLWSFGREFVLLISGAFLIAAPLGAWVMSKWLQGFAYHLPLGASGFLIALVGTLLIAVITISYHAMQAAIANPVDALKSE